MSTPINLLPDFPIPPPPELICNDIVTEARAQYSQCQKCFKETREYNKLILEWNKRHSALVHKQVRPQPSVEEISQEFHSKVDICVEIEQTAIRVNETILFYEKVIEELSRCSLDVSLLQTLQKLQVDLSDIKSKYSEQVRNQRDLLEEKKELKKIHAEIIVVLGGLKRSLSLLVQLCPCPTTWSLDSRGFSGTEAHINATMARRSPTDTPLRRLSTANSIGDLSASFRESPFTPHTPQSGHSEKFTQEAK